MMTIDEAPYPPDLYDIRETVNPVPHPSELNANHVAQYLVDGFLAVERFFTPEEIRTALEGLTRLIDASEEIQIEYERQARDQDVGQGSEKQDSIRKFMGFVQHEPRLNALAAHPGLLEKVAQLMGETPILFQDMALIKPPMIGREKPWHQDHAYFDYPLGTPIVGVWIALDEATTENGCMQVIPGSHLQGPMTHFQRRDWQICDTYVSRASVAVPLQPGGCLFFSGLLHHGTPANGSPHRRRAVQFHYRPEGSQLASHEERMKHFGSDGKDVSC